MRVHLLCMPSDIMSLPDDYLEALTATSDEIGGRRLRESALSAVPCVWRRWASYRKGHGLPSSGVRHLGSTLFSNI